RSDRREDQGPVLTRSTPGTVASASATVAGRKRFACDRSSRTLVAVWRLGETVRVPGTFTGGSTVTESRMPRAGAADGGSGPGTGRTGGGGGGVEAGRTLDESAVDADALPFDESASDVTGRVVPMPLVSAA